MEDSTQPWFHTTIKHGVNFGVAATQLELSKPVEKAANALQLPFKAASQYSDLINYKGNKNNSPPAHRAHDKQTLYGLVDMGR